MNKYEKAIEYLFSVMKKGDIKNDEEQEVFEIAIEALNKVNNNIKNEDRNINFRYDERDRLPNGMLIIERKLYDENDKRYVVKYKKEGKFKVEILTEKQIDDIVMKFL